jgi:methionyl-tRNA formyltransferase
VTRLAFLGTPDIAVGPLRALHDAGHVVALVVTAPDARRGRGGALAPTPVKKCALELKIPVSSRVNDVLDAGVELGVVVAFGSLIRADVLEQVPMVNLHFSLLPRWRGAAPVQRAILAGDERTGVCLMALDEGLDTGPVYACVETPILAHETADELRSRLGELGTHLVLERLAGGLTTLGTPLPQVGESVYAAKIDPGELRIDWERSAVELDRLVRIGRAWTRFRGKRLIIERARVGVAGFPAGQGAGPVHQLEDTGAEGLARLGPGSLLGNEVICGQGRLELLEVRPEGRSPVPFEAWRRGARPKVGECLGE